MTTPDSSSLSQPIPGQRVSNPTELALMARDRFGFWEAKQAQYGPIYYFNLFNRETLILNGSEAWRVFSDPTLVTRVGAALPAIKALFVEENIGLLDGIEHAARKTQVLAAFSHEAFSAYLPVTFQTIEATFERWSKLGEFVALPEIRELGFGLLCQSVLGLSEGEQLTNLKVAYATILQGLANPANFPAALKATETIFGIFDELIQERHKQPQNDGLSRILAATSPDGYKLEDKQVRFELHHLFFAGSGLYAFLVNLVLHLETQPEVLAKVKEEITESAPGDNPLDLKELASLTYLNQVIMEVKRLSPIITMVTGKALKDFEFAGYTVPANSILGLPVYSANIATETYTAAATFDPERFSVMRAEHQHHPYAFAPQGAGEHGCVGYDFTNYMLGVFTVVLVRGYQWELPAQNLELDWSKQVPEPTDGLRGRVIKLG